MFDSIVARDIPSEQVFVMIFAAALHRKFFCMGRMCLTMSVVAQFCLSVFKLLNTVPESFRSKSGDITK